MINARAVVEDDLRVRRLQHLPGDLMAIVSDNAEACPVEMLTPTKLRA